MHKSNPDLILRCRVLHAYWVVIYLFGSDLYWAVLILLSIILCCIRCLNVLKHVILFEWETSISILQPQVRPSGGRSKILSTMPGGSMNLARSKSSFLLFLTEGSVSCQMLFTRPDQKILFLAEVIGFWNLENMGNYSEVRARTLNAIYGKCTFFVI